MGIESKYLALKKKLNLLTIENYDEVLKFVDNENLNHSPYDEYSGILSEISSEIDLRLVESKLSKKDIDLEGIKDEFISRIDKLMGDSN